MKTLVAVRLSHGARWDPAKPVREQAFWDEHARFMDALFAAGKVVLGGPFADDSGTMLVLAAGSVEEARRMLAGDPWAHQDILHPAEFKEWTIFLDARTRAGEGGP